jgi:hypothetical protein
MDYLVVSYFLRKFRFELSFPNNELCLPDDFPNKKVSVRIFRTDGLELKTI